jgi:hypothetical protein
MELGYLRYFISPSSDLAVLIFYCQDFHLAKRHYDLALETNTEAYLPVVLSLAKLYARSIWHTLMGGHGGLNIWHPDEDEIGLFVGHRRRQIY